MSHDFKALFSDVGQSLNTNPILKKSVGACRSNTCVKTYFPVYDQLKKDNIMQKCRPGN